MMQKLHVLRVNWLRMAPYILAWLLQMPMYLLTWALCLRAPAQLLLQLNQAQRPQRIIQINRGMSSRYLFKPSVHSFRIEHETDTLPGAQTSFYIIFSESVVLPASNECNSHLMLQSADFRQTRANRIHCRCTHNHLHLSYHSWVEHLDLCSQSNVFTRMVAWVEVGQ